MNYYAKAVQPVPEYILRYCNTRGLYGALVSEGQVILCGEGAAALRVERRPYNPVSNFRAASV